MNPQLHTLFDADQHDCLNQPPDNTPAYRELQERNRQRRESVRAILQSSEPLSGEDYFRACIIFLHGDGPEDFWTAYTCALKSVELGHPPAKRFAAAAYDRWLMYQGKPQKFGLQYVSDGERLRLWDVDPATTDAERAAWDVPPLQKLHEIAAEATRQYDLSKISMENKPQWLKDAVQRWRAEENGQSQ
jgi:hypothetical protein